MKLTYRWIDDPDGQYRKMCADATKEQEQGKITLAESQQIKKTAGEYRDEAYRQRAKERMEKLL